MYRRILVPLDGSLLAEQALPVAVRLARVSGGTIILLAAVDVSQPYIAYGAMQPLITEKIIEDSLASTRMYLDGVRGRADLAGVAVETQVVQGNPAVMILAIVDEQAIDLVVMTSHGYTGVKRWLLGSTTEKVVHHAPVPVLILHEEKPLSAHQQPDCTSGVRALVPLDTSARAQDAIAPAAALVAALSSPGQGVLHLTQIVVVPKDSSEEEKQAVLQCARQNLVAISESIRDGLVADYGPELHLTVTWSISVDSDIAGGIARVAENGEQSAEAGTVEASDLIAMTTHGYTGIQRWTMGSIAYRVLHATRLPLLLVRPADMIVADKVAKEHPKG